MQTMIIKTNYSFFFKQESVVVWKHGAEMPQYISFNSYTMHSKKRFNSFQNELQRSSKKQYDTINDLYGLAREYGVSANAGHAPIIVGNIAF